MTKQYRGGAYGFRDSLICARVVGVDGTEADIQVKSAYYPVRMTVDEDEDVTAVFNSDTPVTVDFLNAGTFTCNFFEDATADSPKNGSDVLSVTV